MRPPLKHNTPHRPPHFAGEGDTLLITAATHRRHPHLRSTTRKDSFRGLLHELANEVGVELIAWVILDEHYHAVVWVGSAETFPGWIRRLHTLSSDHWNEVDGAPKRQCWYQYGDTTLRTEGDLWTRINYIHRHPAKHGYVKDPHAWEWSSQRESSPLWDDPAQVTWVRHRAASEAVRCAVTCQLQGKVQNPSFPLPIVAQLRQQHQILNGGPDWDLASHLNHSGHPESVADAFVCIRGDRSDVVGEEHTLLIRCPR